MDLTLQQLRSAVRGAARVEEIDGAVAFFRFTEEQSRFYEQRDPDFYRKTKSTSGVILEFDTDSTSLSLEVEVSTGSSRRFVAHSIFVNGEPFTVFGDTLPGETEAAVLSGTIDLGAGAKRVKILFPWAAASRVRRFALDDGSSFSPVKKEKLLILYGDSITQGYDAPLPEQSYASQLTAFLDWDSRNKAIGGEMFCPELAKLSDGVTPDLITVAYGTNDWSHVSQAQQQETSRGFLHNLRRTYPATPIVVMAPIWRADMDREEKTCPFREVAVHLAAVTKELGNAYFVDCFDFVPQDTTLFSDAYLHPNAEGFRHYAQALCARLSEPGPAGIFVK